VKKMGTPAGEGTIQGIGIRTETLLWRGEAGGIVALQGEEGTILRHVG